MSDKVEIENILLGPHMIKYNDNGRDVGQMFGVNAPKTVEYLLKVAREKREPPYILKQILDDRNYDALLFLGLSMLYMKHIM